MCSQTVPGEPGKEEQRANESRHNPLPLTFEPYVTGILAGWPFFFFFFFLPTHLLEAGFLLCWFLALNMEVIRSSETSVHIQTTRRYIPEDDNFHNYHHENLKS
jgi:hypothetical protein